MTGGLRTPGDFCWMNMLTPKPLEACGYFARLLGWTYVEMPGTGWRVQVGGRDIGGLFDLAGPNTPPGTAPVIGVMVKVDSADATCARVASLGGRHQPPFDVMDQGRMAVCFDPTGINFDVWQPIRGPGSDADPALHGAPSWYELMTTDPDRARGFYEALFGWTSERTPMPGFDYWLLSHDGRRIAGLCGMIPELGDLPPAWWTYFTVEDTDRAVRETTELGGTILMPAHDVPGIGRFAGLVSPQGVRFFVYQHGAAR